MISIINKNDLNIIRTSSANKDGIFIDCQCRDVEKSDHEVDKSRIPTRRRRPRMSRRPRRSRI